MNIYCVKRRGDLGAYSIYLIFLINSGNMPFFWVNLNEQERSISWCAIHDLSIIGLNNKHLPRYFVSFPIVINVDPMK